MAAEPAQPAAALPELAEVYWRPRLDASRLRRREQVWTATTVAHVVPWLAAAAGLVWLQPLAVAVAVVLVAHAWVIPLLYAQRGANVLRPLPSADAGAQARSVGLLGDLVSHEARDLHARTGLVVERGGLGVWVVGPAGALLVRDARRRFGRTDCWCVRVADPDLPAGDRIAHLLLALRADETGFATVSNLAFSGATWRVRRRLRRDARAALDAAVDRAAAAPVG